MPDLLAPNSCLLTGTLDEHEPVGMRSSRHALVALPEGIQVVRLSARTDDGTVEKWRRVLSILRSLNVPVVEVGGWEDRGRPYDVDYQGMLDHHTATSARNLSDYPSLGIVRDGRSDLPGPLSQLGLGRSGSVWMIAAGYSNHAGSGGWQGLAGNWSVIGIECENDGIGQPWTAGQVKNLPIVNAVVAHVFGFGPEMVCRHAEWSTSGKIDTATSPFNSGSWLRQRTAEELARITTPTPEVTEVSPYAFRYVSGNLDWLFDPQFQIHIALGSEAQLNFLGGLGVKEKGRVDITVHDLLSGISSNWKR